MAGEQPTEDEFGDIVRRQIDDILATTGFTDSEYTPTLTGRRTNEDPMEPSPLESAEEEFCFMPTPWQRVCQEIVNHSPQHAIDITKYEPYVAPENAILHIQASAQQPPTFMTPKTHIQRESLTLLTDALVSLLPPTPYQAAPEIKSQLDTARESIQQALGALALSESRRDAHMVAIEDSLKILYPAPTIS